MFGAPELQRALDNEELFLLYQALVDMRTGLPLGVESAIRWRHPERGVLHAVPFVNDVPPAGLAPAYMRWIVRTATRQLAAWRADSVDVGRISVNAWPVSLGRELIDDVLAAARDAGLDPALVEIESQPEATYDPATFAALRQIREAGIRVALDDFGEGDLRFAWLRDAPFDVVKIPVMFVLKSGQPFDDAVIKSAVGFARSIGAPTVAEGVETVAIRDRVLALGCDIGQGYLWSQQVPGDELPRVLASIGIDGANGKTVA